MFISADVSQGKHDRTLYRHQEQLLEGSGWLDLEKLKIKPKTFLHIFQMVVKYGMLYTKTLSVLSIIRIASCITQLISLSKFHKLLFVFHLALPFKLFI